MVYIKLIRPLNLLMILLTMVLFRLTIIDNAFYGLFDFKPSLGMVEFILLVATTVLVAAGGYVINDIFDSDIDRINRPDKLLIENKVDPLKAYNYYKLLVALAIFCNIILAIKTRNIRLSAVPVLILVALNFYAQYFKSQLLIGNLVVSICSAFVIFLPGLYESEKTVGNISLAKDEIRTGIFLAASFYALFAFLTTFLREVIKDMEDLKGDNQYGCRTIPIVWGIKGAKLFCFVLVILILAVWISVAFFFPAMYLPHLAWGVVMLYILPLLAFLYLLYRSSRHAHFHRLSIFVKLYMALGIFSMVYFFFITGPYLLFLHYLNFLQKLI